MIPCRSVQRHVCFPCLWPKRRTYTLRFIEMAPIARSVVQSTQKLSGSKRSLTLALIEAATTNADLAHFTVAKIKSVISAYLDS